MSWPYTKGAPTRCVRCGSAPAVALLDRPRGPWCRDHLPWLPIVPSWRVGKCIRCDSRGAVVVAPGGRVTGPVCRDHRPAPAGFNDQANITLAGVMARWSK